MKNKKTIVGVIMILAFVAVVGASFALTSLRKTSTKQNIITTGELTFDFSEEETNAISLTGALPITDRKGVTLSNDDEVFDFTVSANNNAADISYSILLERDSESTLPDDAIKVYLTEVDDDGNETWVHYNFYRNNKFDLPTLNEYNGGEIDRVSFSKEEAKKSKQYRLRMWISKDANLSDSQYMNKTAKYNVSVVANFRYDDDIEYTGLGGIGGTAHIANKLIFKDGKQWHMKEIYYGDENDNTFTLSDDKELELLFADCIDLNGNIVSNNTIVSLIDENLGYNRDEIVSSALENFAVNLKALWGIDELTVSLPSTKMFVGNTTNQVRDFSFSNELHANLKGAHFLLDDSEYTDSFLEAGYYYIDGQLRFDYTGYTRLGLESKPYEFNDKYVPGKPTSYQNSIKPVVKVKWMDIKDLVENVDYID